MNVALELQPCFWSRCGVGTYTYEIAKRLVDKDNIKYHGNVFNFMRKNEGKALLDIKMPIIENCLLPYGMYRRLWNIIPVPYNLLFPSKVDVTLFFNFIVPPRINGRVITTIHDMTFIRCPETMEKQNYTHIKKGIKNSVERSDIILTVSEFSKHEICSLLNVSQEKVKVVYSAPSLDDQEVEFDHIRKKFGIDREYILFVGTVEPRKNLVRLLKAFEYLKDSKGIPHKLVLAGGKGWNDEEIFKTVNNMGHRNDVIFTGYISSTSKNSLYKNADVFVFPSIYEGFGIPPLEAMASECPVVCANIASLPEVVGEAACLVDPYEIEDIALGIYKVLTDNQYKNVLIREGSMRAKQFTWEKTAEKVERVITDLA